MGIGNLSAAGLISCLTKESADQGLSYYTTIMQNERISAIVWFNKNNPNKQTLKQLRINSFTFEAVSSNLMLFPLRNMNDEIEFGIYDEVGKSYTLNGIQYSGFEVYGPAGQTIRFYIDAF